MSGAAMMGGVDASQGPPLWGPMSFFVTAPLALIAAGVVLVPDASALSMRWSTGALVATHLGTLGFAAMVMLGALYQMLPVIASSPVPAARLGHLVHGALAAGTATLCWALASNNGAAFLAAAILLGLAFTLFIAPVLWALWRAPARSATVFGMRVSVLGLLVVVTLGVLLTLARSGRAPLFSARSVFYLHLCFGALLWIGGLIAAVSWQVLPMFYLCAEAPLWSRIVVPAALVLSAIICGALMLANPTPGWVYAIAAAPAALAVWLVHPLVSVVSLRRRRRRRADESLRFWYLGLGCGPLCLLAMVLSAWTDDPRWPVVLGFTALWGWAGLIMHGMLTRIVPFLVWFHRYAHLVGHADVPPMRRLLPPRHARVGLYAHAATLLLGWVAIGLSPLGIPWVSGAFGVALALSGVVLASELIRVLRHAVSPDAV